jgi:hypothetical protein
MSRKKKMLVGNIGYCENKDLGINKPGGHYVYIRGLNGNKCDVNVVTSLEDSNGLNEKRLLQVRKGNVYPIPVNDSNFSRWSGIGNNSIKDVGVVNIKKIGNKKIKRRHKFFIGKFIK